MDNMLLILIIVVITQFLVILGMFGRTTDNTMPSGMVIYPVPQTPVETDSGCGAVFFAFLLLGGAAIVLIFLI